MADSKARYEKAHRQNREFFEGAPVYYQNDAIEIRDARGCFRPMERPWKRRPLTDVRGLFVHHRASWNSFVAMQRNVVLPRYKAAPNKKHDRIAYTLGVDHQPELTLEGRVVVWLFNDPEAVSWHSGSPGKDSARFTEWRRRQGPGNSANQYTVGLNLSGFFASAGYPESHPDEPSKRASAKGLAGNLIAHPSTEQAQAVWGVYCWLRKEFGATPDSVFGHVDSGKAACPGTSAMALVDAIRREVITNDRELDRWLSGRDDIWEPGGWPMARWGGSPSVDYVTECQRLLVAAGYDLGNYGPNNDGVDGQWGKASRLALMDFEESAGLLVNGQPEEADYQALLTHVEGVS